MPDVTPTIVVIFGGTGDLSRKKLLPSLVDLYVGKYVPSVFRVVGFSRRDFSDDDYCAFIKDVAKDKEHGHTQEQLDSFLEQVSYVQGDFSEASGYENLKKHLKKIDDEIGQCTNKLLYLAVPPKFYENIFEQLKASGLSEPCSDESGWTRVLVEKPFGRDLETAKELEKKLCASFKEEQIFRIDHYLAKDALQNIIAFRFANALLENSWNKEHIEKVHIKLAEDFGVEERASFYDGIGALRDVGQNHMLQMLALVAMDDPGDYTADSLRERRGAVLRALCPVGVDEFGEHVVRGQYSGYKDIEGVEEDSDTETYFLLKTFIDSPRWEGVPFYLESGKKLSRTENYIRIEFRPKLPCVCGEKDSHGHQNVLVFEVKPSQKITLTLLTKKKGLEYKLEERTLSLGSDDGSEYLPAIDAYEKVLYDCILGDQTLFTSGEEVSAAWAYITPILENWNEIELKTYEEESEGPSSKLKDEIVDN